MSKSPRRKAIKLRKYFKRHQSKYYQYKGYYKSLEMCIPYNEIFSHYSFETVVFPVVDISKEAIELSLLEKNKQLDLINERIKHVHETLINNRNMLEFNDGKN